MSKSCNLNSYKAIRIVRIANDLSVKALAEKVGVSSSFISEVENGKKKLNLGTYDNIAIALNMRPFELMRIVEEFKNLEGKVTELRRFHLTLIKALEILIEKEESIN